MATVTVLAPAASTQLPDAFLTLSDRVLDRIEEAVLAETDPSVRDDLRIS